MPKVIVEETTVYTLAELKVMNQKAYDKAIEKITEDVNEDRFYITWLSQDVTQWFKDGPGKLSDNKCPFEGGDWEEWSADHGTITYHFDTYVAEYMQRNKLIGKNRTLYKWLRDNGDCRVEGKVQDGCNRNSKFTPLDYDFGGDFITDITQDARGEAAEVKINAQAEAVLKHIAGMAQEVRDYVMKWIEADVDYRYSEEFAVQEAEAQEMTFHESGYIFR